MYLCNHAAMYLCKRICVWSYIFLVSVGQISQTIYYPFKKWSPDWLGMKDKTFLQLLQVNSPHQAHRARDNNFSYMKKIFIAFENYPGISNLFKSHLLFKRKNTLPDLWKEFVTDLWKKLWLPLLHEISRLVANQITCFNQDTSIFL